MTRPLFFVAPERLRADEVVLDGDEGRHAAVVRRIAMGERVDVADGAGAVAECRVVAVRGDSLVLAVENRRTERAPSPRLVVVQALAKGGRADDAVEAMTEVGVDEIVPWAAARSVTKWDDARADTALARWRAVARAAAKQSRRARIPQIASLATTTQVVRLLDRATLAVVLHESAAERLSAVEAPTSGVIAVVVGPEGGLTDDELAAFTAVAGPALRLGTSVLRTSTAGVAAAAVLLARCGRW
ncbi:MAG: 16S rRNA (uracil(1498)-N(3))-methyltransferase [Mycobacteriales bacterium]|nr:16S rRNA (uracil(1498)-N(3))-methyltransferase [Frankia sp.]